MICYMDPNTNPVNYSRNNSNNYDNPHNRQEKTVVIVNNYNEKTKEEKKNHYNNKKTKEEKRKHKERKKEKKLQKEFNKQTKNAIEEAERAIRLKKEKRERKYRDILYYSGQNIANILRPYLDYLKKHGGTGITKTGGFYHIKKNSILESWHYNRNAGVFSLKILLSLLVFFILITLLYYYINHFCSQFTKDIKDMIIGIITTILIIFVIIYLINVYPHFDERKIPQEDQKNIEEIENAVLQLNDSIEEFNYQLSKNR